MDNIYDAVTVEGRKLGIKFYISSEYTSIKMIT